MDQQLSSGERDERWGNRDGTEKESRLSRDVCGLELRRTRGPEGHRQGRGHRSLAGKASWDMRCRGVWLQGSVGKRCWVWG